MPVELSVVVPCFNEARTLRRILEAVRSSGIESLEVIVVDDCSTDGSVALLEGELRPLVDQLARFTLRLSRNGEVVDEGGGKNSLRSPALCLGELASAISRRMPDEPLSAGELVSSGTLTESTVIVPGETWTAHVEGLDLPDLTLQTTT